MKYIEAKEFVKKKQYLKGTIDDKGFNIGDIIIVPVDNSKRDLFLQSYIHNGGNVICTYDDVEDVQVWAIDTAHLEKANVLFYNVLGS